MDISYVLMILCVNDCLPIVNANNKISLTFKKMTHLGKSKFHRRSKIYLHKFTGR